MTNDHDAPDAADLASTYLDGHADDEACARAESDPQVMELVERFRSLRAELTAVDPPDEARRDAAILAALGAQRSPAAEARATAPTPLPTARRGNWRTTSIVTAAAAAAVAIAVAGIVVLGVGGGGDDDSADAPTTRDAASADTAFGRDLAMDTMSSDDGAIAGAATDRTESASAAAPEATATGEATAAGTVSDAGEAADATKSGTAGDGAPSAATLTVLASGPELYAFATAPAALDEQERGDPACDPPGDATYVDTASYVVGDTATIVDVFLDDDGTALAYDVATCDEVVRAVP